MVSSLDPAGAAGLLAQVSRMVQGTRSAAAHMLGSAAAQALAEAGRPLEALETLRVFFQGQNKGPTQVLHEMVLERLAHQGHAREAWEVVTRDMTRYRTHVPNRHRVRLLLLAAVQGGDPWVARQLLGEGEHEAEAAALGGSGDGAARDGEAPAGERPQGAVQGGLEQRARERVRELVRQLPEGELEPLRELAAQDERDTNAGAITRAAVPVAREEAARVASRQYSTAAVVRICRSATPAFKGYRRIGRICSDPMKGSARAGRLLGRIFRAALLRK